MSRIGEINFNSFGSEMVIEKYNGCLDVWVRFIETNNLVQTNYANFKKGIVKNPYDKSVWGVGYIGEGDYKISINGKKTPQYILWSNMINRCYNKIFHSKQPTYENCTVCDEWYNFQTFAEWYDENYYSLNEEKMNLDKDILVKGNKIYSPDTCVFVPHFINTLFIKNDILRGNLPIGVIWHKRDRKYRAQCNKNGKVSTLGSYNTPEEAFEKYKSYKEWLINEIAATYKDKIPFKLYDAMINYQVEVND